MTRLLSWILICPSFSSVCPSFAPVWWGIWGSDDSEGLSTGRRRSGKIHLRRASVGRLGASGHPKRNKNGIFPSSHHLFRSHSSTHSKMVSALRTSLKRVLSAFILCACCVY